MQKEANTFMQTFEELTLSAPVLRAITEMGYTAPTPIQAQTLPALMGPATDFLGMAATGTGKTAAFGIPLIERINVENRATQAIVLCPTRELAQQVSQQLTLLGKYKDIQAHAIYGGTGYGEQRRNLSQGTFIIVATPGRLIDHLKQGSLQLKDVKTVVLDEADEMISMGFKEELEYLLKHVPKNECNTWLFAATMNPQLRRVADSYLRTPKHAQINKKEMLSGTVRQIFYTVRDKNKPRGLCKLIEMADDFYGLIFCQTKAQVVDLTDFLRREGYKVECLHGDKTQREREHTLAHFRDRKTTILVCSDVAARGLDVKELTHVINFSIPHDLDSYVHRIGRTGRSGNAGLAMSLVSPAQNHLIRRIEQLTKSKIEAGVLPSKKEISEKKLARALPAFLEGKGHDKALAILGENWTAELEKLTKNEIAARFLALSYPEVFNDKDKPDEIENDLNEPFAEPERRFSRRPFQDRRQGGFRSRPPFREDRERRSDDRPRREFRPAFQPGFQNEGGGDERPRRPFPRRDFRGPSQNRRRLSPRREFDPNAPTAGGAERPFKRKQKGAGTQTELNMPVIVQ